MAHTQSQDDPTRFVSAIAASELTIYDAVEVGDPKLWIPTPALESLLDGGLGGMNLSSLALRTRSKVVKERVCEVLGYPVPVSFKKTKPRFLGQQFDTHVQKALNLQIWNEELSPARRYVLIGVDQFDTITRVRVLTGDSLAKLDTTGTLTQKYQAKCVPGAVPTELVSATDTQRLARLVTPSVVPSADESPVAAPRQGEILPVAEVFDRLSVLVGNVFDDAGSDQERNRGAALHRLVCNELGYARYQDDGRFPDVRHQLLEVKLQTSPTIDLGVCLPNGTAPLDIPLVGGQQIRHRDVRYAVFYGETNNQCVRLTHLFVTTGEDFFGRFPQFQGKVLNKKLQMKLPSDFFGR